MKFVRIEPGEFLMGSRKDQIDLLLRLYPSSKRTGWWEHEQPQHPVTIARPFFLAVHEVTQGQYKAVMGENPSRFQGSENRPVEQVSWLDAVKFCNKLSEQDGRKHDGSEGAQLSNPGGNGYRLPTEAEWEYACRAETEALYPFGDDASAVGRYAWYIENSAKATHPVGVKPPNPWGLYDMMGNVWEWCADSYDEKYDVSYRPSGPPGTRRASHRAIRGGAWECFAGFCRPAYRGSFQQEFRGDFLGFRVVTDVTD
jgi:formylglycine-generating enzyme required for sulfatase activity